jgi:hypothetical protein
VLNAILKRHAVERNKERLDKELLEKLGGHSSTNINMLNFSLREEINDWDVTPYSLVGILTTFPGLILSPKNDGNTFFRNVC